MNIIFLYHNEKPKRGMITSDSLPSPYLAFQPIRSVLLLQRSPQLRDQSKSVEIRNENVKISVPGLVKWCHSYKVEHKGHHIIRYEPVFSSSESRDFITYMRLLECKMPIKEDKYNAECTEKIQHERKCYTEVASWTRGSDGFSFPNDVGYPLDSTISDNFLLEIHYQVGN
jgi:Copper type II ascorbate-dependent monooxygenase, N-terminal domain